MKVCASGRLDQDGECSTWPAKLAGIRLLQGDRKAYCFWGFDAATARVPEIKTYALTIGGYLTNVLI